MKYSRSLDLILASLREAASGKMQTAAACFEKALKQKDLPATLAALETQQAEAFDSLKKRNPTVAAMFDTVSAKLKKAAPKKEQAKQAKPVVSDKPKGKQTAADDEPFSDTLDDMTLADDGEGVDGLEFDDLTLDDLEGLDDDGVDEMPTATAKTKAIAKKKVKAEDDSDDEDDKGDDDDEDEDDKEESEADDGDDDEDDKGDKEESSVKAKMTMVSANLDALTRLQESRKQAQNKSAK